MAKNQKGRKNGLEKIETWTIPITQIKLEYKKGTILWNPLKKSIFLKRDLFVTIHGRRFEVGAFGDFEKVKGRSLLSGNVGQLGTQMSHKDNVVNIVVVLVLVLLFVFVMVNVRVNRIATMEEATNAIHKCSSYTTHIYSLLLNLRHSNTPLLLSLLLLFSSLF